MNIGVLYVRGRRTGSERAVRLRFSVEADGSLLISAGGLHEQWPVNLRANPACRFEMDGGAQSYRAVEQAAGRFRLMPVT